MKLTYASLSVCSKIKPITTFTAIASVEVDAALTAETQLTLVQILASPVVSAQREAIPAGTLVASGKIHTPLGTASIGDQALVHI